MIKWCEWSDYDSATSKGSAYLRWYIKVTFGDCIGSTSILIWILLFSDKNSGRKNYSRLICILSLNCCCYYVTHAMTNFIEITIFGVLVEAFDWLSRQNVARILTFKWNAPLILIQLKNIIQWNNFRRDCCSNLARPHCIRGLLRSLVFGQRASLSVVICFI